MNPANAYYGHKAILARYCKISPFSVPKIDGYLQHGWNAHHGFGSDRDIYPGSYKFVWSNRVLAALQDKGWGKCLAIGSPWAYLLQDSTIGVIPENRSGVLLYPFHGWEGGRVTGDHRALIDQVNAVEVEPVTVCLYWLEYETPEVREVYEAAGFRVICHGHRDEDVLYTGSESFLCRQYSELIKHRRVISNRLSTAIMYAASIGCEVAVYGDPMVINDPGLASGQVSGSFSESAFPEFFGFSTDSKRTQDIARRELGFDIILSRVELAKVLGWSTLEAASEAEGFIDDYLLADIPSRCSEEFLFSVVLTTYNRPDLLKDALASVGRQSVRDFEVILINDNGDPVESLLPAYDFPITYIRQGRNRGLSAARNAGLRLARGRYIVYLDDDDIYLPNHLAVLAEAFEQHPDSVIYTGVEYVSERLEEGQRIEIARGQPFKHESFDRDRLFVQNYIPVNTWAHPRAMLASVGEFDTGLAAFEDWDMLLRLATRYPFVHVPTVTSEVHTRPTGAGGDHMLGRERKNFPALYRELYGRYSGSASDGLQRGRQQMLESLGERRQSSLERWLAERLPTATENCLIDEHLRSHAGGPLIGVVVLDPEGQAEQLMATLKSLIGERFLYATLRILVITKAEVPATSAADKLHFLPMGSEPLPEQINRAVETSDCDWFMLARAGDLFTQSGLMIAGLELIANPQCRAVYGDQLQRLPDGNLGGAFLPGFNLDLLLSFPLVMARHWLYRRDLFLAAGGFDAAYPDAFEFDLLTRLIEQEGLAGLGHIDEPLLITEAPSLRDNPDERRVIERHLANRGYQARVLPGLPARYRIDYGHAARPLVSIIVISDAPLVTLQRCVDSLLEKTRYTQYELLLADIGGQPDVSAWLHEVSALGDARVRVVSEVGGAVQNRAAELARGEYLLLLSGAAAIVDETWLEELLNHAQRPEVGVVGAKLLTPEGRVAQAGLLLGVNGPATPAFAGEAAGAAGYMQRLQVDQNYSAVAEACLMIRSELFRQLGGLDMQLAAFRDVDLCLRVRSAGYLTVWAAHAVVLHEAAATPVDAAAQDLLYERHLPQLANDQAYNRNLALSGRGFDLESDTSLTWRPLTWRPLPVVLAHPADPWGCGHYRVIQPFSALKAEGLVDGTLSMGLLQVTDLERYDPDVIVLQRQIGDERLEAMRRIHKLSRAFTLYELDDYLPNLPLKSVHRAQMPRDILKSLRRGLEFVDRFVVSTQPLAEAFAGLHGDIRVVENRLPVKWWKGLESHRQRGRKPRVGWAGGVSHTGDLDLIVDVVRELASEVEWVFMGMCPDAIRPYVNEVHAGVDIESYPSALARLDLDLALAPVEPNLFNECKSNLRLLEYGACGFPVVCSDLVCYRGDLPVTRVKNRFRDWVEAIRMHINDLDAAAQAGDRLREAVYRDWMLEGENLERWRKAWMPD